MFFVVFGAVLVNFIVLMATRLRVGFFPAVGMPDGKGPALYWLPRYIRPAMNEWLIKHGWPPAFDEHLNQIPRSQRRAL